MKKRQPSFLQRWTTENNRLVQQYLTEDHNGLTLLSEFQRLVKEIQGLPPRIPSLCVELPVVFNLCYLQYTVKPQGGADLSAALCGALQRVLRASQSGQAVLTVERLLNPDPDVTVLLKHAIQLVQSTDLVEPVCLLATLLALSLLGSQRDKSSAILQTVRACKTPASSKSEGNTAASGKGCAIRPHLIPSYVLGTDEESRGLHPPVDMVEYLLACCYYLDGNTAVCLQELERPAADPLFLPASYLKGYVLYGEKRYEESILALQDCLSSPVLDLCSKARVLNLMGCCCAQQGKPHTAIQLYREALRCDFSLHMALYNISLQYRALGLGDVELETLNLLVTALENEDSRKDSCKNQVLDLVLQLNNAAPGSPNLLTGPQNGILLHQALYVLAKRCLEQERYEAAAQRYVDLLAAVLETPVMQAPTQTGSPFPLLDIQTVYCEAALSLLKAHRYEDTISVCDKLLTKIPPHNQWQTDLDPPNPSHNAFSQCHGAVQTSHDSFKLEDSVTPSSNRCDSGDDLFDSYEDSEERTSGKMSKKRGREPSEQGGMQSVRENTEICNGRLKSVLPLMYKAEALYRLEEYQEAVGCYDRLLKMLCDIIPEESHTDNKIDKRTDSSQPTQKRRRTEEGFLPIVPDSGTTSEVSEVRRKLLVMKAEAYQNKALILIGQDKLPAALQCLRLSVQSNPDSTVAMYNHTLLLWRMGRRREAAHNWLQYRGVDTRLDSLQLAHLLRQKEQAISTVSDDASEGISDRHLMMLDKATFQQLMDSRTPQRGWGSSTTLSYPGLFSSASTSLQNLAN